MASVTDSNPISKALAEEQRAGTLNPSAAVVLPSIPSARTDDISVLRRAVMAMKQIMDVREGVSASVLDKHLTLRDLMNEGALSINVGNARYVGNQAASLSVGSGYIDTRPVLTLPPTITNLEAAGAFKNVILSWEMLDYANHSYVEVWRSTTDAIGTATLNGTTTANVYTDASGTTGVTYYYWVRAVAINGALGAFNAVAGTAATLGGLVGTDLADLIITADKLARGTYPNINMVPNPGAEDGAVAWSKSWDNGNGTFAVDTTIKTGGLQSFKLTKTGGQRAGCGCFAMPVIPGETYAWRLKWRGSSAYGSDHYVRAYGLPTTPPANWVNVSDTGVDITNLQNNVAITTGFVEVKGTYTVPAGIYWVSIGVVNDTASTNLDLYWDDVGFGRQITAEFMAANSIAVGTAAIQTGAIVNAMIGTAAIDNAKIADLDAVKINAGYLDAARIQAGSLHANKLTAYTITAGEIAAGTITANEIAGATITAAKMVAGTITAASGIIADLNADIITAGAIRGINISAGTFGTKGTYLTSATSAADGTVNVKNTTDFHSSGGTAIVYDSTNDRDYFTYTGKTSITLTGCSGVLAHTNGSTVIPTTNNGADQASMVIDAMVNELRFRGNIGSGTHDEIASIGISGVLGSDSVVATFGSTSVGANRVGVYGQSYSSYGVAGGTSSGVGVYGSTVTGTAGVHGVSMDDTNSAVFGNNSDAGPGVLGSSSSGSGVKGSASTGHGGEFVGNSTKGSILMTPRSAPSTATQGALYYNSSDDYIYAGNGSSWRKLAYYVDIPPPPVTCFPAGAMVLMADGAWRPIQHVRTGDRVWGPKGPTAVLKIDRPRLGSRRMLKFADGHMWSEEHAHWVRTAEGKQWWWTDNVKTWKAEVEAGAIGGLLDNDSILTGDAVEFAHLTGWKANQVQIARGFDARARLYLPLTGGTPIVVNGYLCGAGVDQAGFDYTALDWDAARPPIGEDHGT